MWDSGLLQSSDLSPPESEGFLVLLVHTARTRVQTFHQKNTPSFLRTSLRIISQDISEKVAKSLVKKIEDRIVSRRTMLLL